jgi:glutamate racemase
LAVLDSKKPIGIFDSGIGGLTVANAIQSLLPNERLIYFGDTAHLPYGDKSAEAIKTYSLAICKHLLDLNCKAIVVACNSAATTAHDHLRQLVEPQAIIIDVVEPLVEKVALENHQKIGIIATQATISSNQYQSRIKALLPSANIQAKATPLIVPMIEEGFVDNDISNTIIKEYLSTKEFKDLDVLLLACTHYPLIRNVIQRHLIGVEVLDSTNVTSMALKAALEERGLLSSKVSDVPNAFYVSDYTEVFESKARLFFGENVHLTERNIW